MHYFFGAVPREIQNQSRVAGASDDLSENQSAVKLRLSIEVQYAGVRVDDSHSRSLADSDARTFVSAHTFAYPPEYVVALINYVGAKFSICSRSRLSDVVVSASNFDSINAMARS